MQAVVWQAADQTEMMNVSAPAVECFKADDAGPWASALGH